MGEITVSDVDWSIKLSSSVSEVKGVVRQEGDITRIFRCTNKRRWWCCPHCLFWQECILENVTEFLVQPHWIVECPYFVDKEYGRDYTGNDQAAQKSKILSFSKLVTTVICSRLFIINS